MIGTFFYLLYIKTIFYVSLPLIIFKIKQSLDQKYDPNLHQLNLKVSDKIIEENLLRLRHERMISLQTNRI